MSTDIKTICKEKGSIVILKTESMVVSKHFQVWIPYGDKEVYSGYYKSFLVENVHPDFRMFIVDGAQIIYHEYYEDNEFGTRKHCSEIQFFNSDGLPDMLG